MLAVCCLFALPYFFGNGLNGAIEDEGADVVAAVIGAKWAMGKEKVDEEVEFTEGSVASVSILLSTSSSSLRSFCSTLLSLLGGGEEEAAACDSDADEDMGGMEADPECVVCGVPSAGASADGHAAGCCGRRGRLALRVSRLGFWVPRLAFRDLRFVFCVSHSMLRVLHSMCRSDCLRGGGMFAYVRVAGAEVVRVVAVGVAEAEQ